VVATVGDVVQMLIVIAIIAILASIMAIRRATKVDPRSVLGT
jgi:ABC-type lipoprotein release transport system permease subunit